SPRGPCPPPADRLLQPSPLLGGIRRPRMSLVEPLGLDVLDREMDPLARPQHEPRAQLVKAGRLDVHVAGDPQPMAAPARAALPDAEVGDPRPDLAVVE